MSKLATPEGTVRYAARFAGKTSPAHFRAWPPPAADDAPFFRLSSIGMGSYTGPSTDEGDLQYAESVAEAARSGINVIDAAINYRNMRSERALGKGIRALITAREAARDELFVMTKGGYLPFDGAVPADPSDYLRETYLATGILRPEEIVAGCHAIAPRFLANQLERSLHNLGLEGVDVYFLHNVEQQLDEVPREEFDRRVTAAFHYLEEQVRAGRIGVYGAATWNGFRVPPERKEHLSLERLWEIATEVGGEEHHFRALQLPYNIGMPEALTEPTQKIQGQRVSLLDAAYALGMMVVASVPLLQTQILAHLPANFAEDLSDLPTPALRAIQFVRSTPGILAPLVGMRQVQHVKENAALAAVDPLDAQAFAALFNGRG